MSGLRGSQQTHQHGSGGYPDRGGSREDHLMMHQQDVPLIPPRGLGGSGGDSSTDGETSGPSSLVSSTGVGGGESKEESGSSPSSPAMQGNRGHDVEKSVAVRGNVDDIKAPLVRLASTDSSTPTSSRSLHPNQPGGIVPDAPLNVRTDNRNKDAYPRPPPGSIDNPIDDSLGGFSPLSKLVEAPGGGKNGPLSPEDISPPETPGGKAPIGATGSHNCDPTVLPHLQGTSSGYGVAGSGASGAPYFDLGTPRGSTSGVAGDCYGDDRSSMSTLNSPIDSGGIKERPVKEDEMTNPRVVISSDRNPTYGVPPFGRPDEGSGAADSPSLACSGSTLLEPPWPPTNLYTQSDTDIQSPNTTVTTLGSMRHGNSSVPHVQNVTFAPFPKILNQASYPPSRNTSSVMLGPGDSRDFGATSSGYGSVPNSNLSLTRLKQRDHLESQSERDYHKYMQNHHKKTRVRHFTDPVDFEGILRIIGGCNVWQAWVYFLIALQQIPHAMLNLIVIFMMISPDHWCYERSFDTSVHQHANHWTHDEIMNISIPTKNSSMAMDSKCYIRDLDYHALAHATFQNVTEDAARYAEITSAPYKTCTNWTYDRTEMKHTIVTQWNLVCSQNLRRADAHLAYALGYLFGCILSGLCSDRFGRKPTIVGFGVLASIFGLILPYSTYFIVFLVVRFLGAVCNEAADLAAYVLCMEITGTKYRALVGSLQQTPWAIGYTLLAAIAYLTQDWRTIQMIAAALHTVSILLACVLPESPRWLIMMSRVSEAEYEIRRACRMNKKTLPPDLELTKHTEHRGWVKKHERYRLTHLLKSKELVIRTSIVFLIWAVTALVYYGISLSLSDQSVRTKRHFSGNLFLNNAIAGAIELPVLFVTVALLSAGRKRSMMSCLVLAGIMMLGVVLSPNDDRTKPLRLVFMLMGKASAQAAFCILYIFTSELYPTVIRNTVVGMASSVGRVGSGVAGYIAILSDIALPALPMIIFGVFSFVAGVMTIFLPETQNQPMPETLKDAVDYLKSETYGCRNVPQFSQCEDYDLMNDAAQINKSIDELELPEPFEASGDIPNGDAAGEPACVPKFDPTARKRGYER